MTLLKAIVRPDKVESVKDALGQLGISGMTVTEVRGHGKQKGHAAIYRGKDMPWTSSPKCRSRSSCTTTSRSESSEPSFRPRAQARSAMAACS